MERHFRAGGFAASGSAHHVKSAQSCERKRSLERGLQTATTYPGTVGGIAQLQRTAGSCTRRRVHRLHSGEVGATDSIF